MVAFLSVVAAVSKGSISGVAVSMVLLRASARGSALRVGRRFGLRVVGITAGALPIGVWSSLGSRGRQYGTREDAENTNSAPALLWVGVVCWLELYYRFSSPCLLARCAGDRVVAL